MRHEFDGLDEPDTMGLLVACGNHRWFKAGPDRWVHLGDSEVWTWQSVASKSVSVRKELIVKGVMSNV